MKATEVTAQQAIRQATAIEAERDAKKKERQERQQQKHKKAKQAFLEKLVAPFLLLVTVLISLVLYFFY